MAERCGGPSSCRGQEKEPAEETHALYEEEEPWNEEEEDLEVLDYADGDPTRNCRIEHR